MFMMINELFYALLSTVGFVHYVYVELDGTPDDMTDFDD